MTMIAKISTQLNCSEEQLWSKIIDPSSLQFIASPLLSFAPVQEGALDGHWQAGVPYPLKLYLLKFIPLGRHTIQLVSIDKATNTILSREHGLIARVWNHIISFQQVAPDVVAYTDEIEIQAGWLTPMVWLFAHLFYRHRQRRWKILLRKEYPRAPAV